MIDWRPAYGMLIVDVSQPLAPSLLPSNTLELGRPLPMFVVPASPAGVSVSLLPRSSTLFRSPLDYSAAATPTAVDLPAGARATLSFNAPVQTRYVRLVVVNPGAPNILGGATVLDAVAT